MHTPETVTPKQQQDEFTLSFLHWLNTYYVRKDTDGYYSKALLLKGEDTPPLSGAQCLALYRTYCVPPLPAASTDLDTQLFKTASQSIQRVMVLVGGYIRIGELLRTPGNVPKEAINDIILETNRKMDEIK